MKQLWMIAVGVIGGLLGAGLLLLAARPPRGEAIRLLPPPTPHPILVHVAGAVAEPGVYPLPVGCRVRDAIQASGGLLPDADQNALNLAAFLEDGQRLYIPSLPAPEESTSDQTEPEISAQTPININTATVEQLDMLPGIGPVLAQRIVDYRQTHGSFQRAGDILEVEGIGPTSYERIRQLISVQ
ncbi:MAG: helix-hairpin-helix domain-containing protein [Anaerolineales bacterium]|jgi:competence protein ComEA